MSKDDLDNEIMMNRRAAILLGVSAASLSILGWRLYGLQVKNHDFYQQEAIKNQVDHKVILPKRGSIFDVQGRIIADSVTEYDLYLQTPSDGLNVQKIQALKQAFQDDPQLFHKIENKVISVSHYPSLLAQNISRKQAVHFEFLRPDLSSFEVRQQVRRHYFMGNALSPITGYVSRGSQKDKLSNPFALMREFRIGKSGLERQYEQQLRGASGSEKIKVDARGNQLQELDKIGSENGADLRLNIDAQLQQYTMNRLEEHLSGAVVILDALTGGVKTLASYPFYDAEEFKNGLSENRWQELRKNSYKPLMNKTLSGLYAPGSSFKPIVALAALKAGISPDTTHFCNGHVSLGKSRFHCWKKQGHGLMTMHSAIQQSCDVWFYQVARQLGIDEIAKMARKMGLGQKTGIDLHQEKAGLVADTEWKKQNLNAPFYPGEVLIHGIGQGFTLTTPLQLARSYASLINGGRLISPSLVDQVIYPDGVLQKNINAKNYTSSGVPALHGELIRAALIDAVNVPKGTAWRSRIPSKYGFSMAGKTGTTQVRRISQAERKSGIRKDNIAWNLRDHALFTGFAPVHDPRYVVSVLVEHGVSGARSAAPIARDILIKMAELGYISAEKEQG